MSSEQAEDSILRMLIAHGSLLCLESGFKARTRIEIVAQRVPNEIEAEDGQHHRERGKEHEVRRVEQVRAGVIEHRPPTCCRRRNTQSEETHSGFGQNR